MFTFFYYFSYEISPQSLVNKLNWGRRRWTKWLSGWCFLCLHMQSSQLLPIFQSVHCSNIPNYWNIIQSSILAAWCFFPQTIVPEVSTGGSITVRRTVTLKELCFDILSHFNNVQNFFQIKENLKVMILQGRRHKRSKN